MDCPSEISPESIIIRMGSRGSKDWLYQSEPELPKINGGNIILVFPYRAERRLCNPLRL